MTAKSKVILVGFLAILSVVMVAFFVAKHKNQIARNISTPTALAKDEEKAVFLYKTNNYEQGGLIEIASTDAPTIRIGSVGISGSATVTTYQATYDDLMNYLVHNDKYEQKNTSVDVTKLTQVSQTTYQVSADNDSNLPLSVGDNGIWFVQANLNGTIGQAFVIRTDVGSIASEGENQIIIWNQSFRTKKLISGASVTVYNLTNGIKQIETETSDNEGIAKVKATQDADIAVVESNGNKSILPLNYKYLNNSNYTAFDKKNLNNQYYVFTDRPLYRPGDVVKFKAIIRQEDDAVFTLAQGKVMAEIIKGYDDSSKIASQNFTISDKGTIDGQFTLPADVSPDNYTLVVKSKDGDNNWGNNTVSFDVEEFVKPEYGLEATSSDAILTAGDDINVNVHGGYFSGQPLAGETVKYTVYSSSYGDYGFRDEFDPSGKWHWSWDGQDVFDGTAKLNESGDATITYKTPLTKEGETSKVYTIETEYVNESGRPSVSTVNVLVRAGEFGIYKKDYSWGAQVGNKLAMPFIVEDKDGKTVSSGMPVTVKTHWSHWKEKTDDNGQTTYEEEKEDLPDQNTNSGNGEFVYSFTPSKTGLYEITLQAKDPRGNIVQNTYSVWAYSPSEYSRYSDAGEGSSGITVKADKEKYNPGDTARLTVLSNVADRDAFLTMERGRTRRYQVIHISGTQTTISEKLQDDDIPNIFANVSTFGARDIDSDSSDLIVSAVSKKINVSIKPDRDTYGPGDMAVVDVATTDSNGNPISADTAVWAIDKALSELADSNTQDIFDTFWYQRGDGTSSSYSLEGISSFGAESGGCFGKGTQVLMADSSKKNIEDVSVGDKVLTYAGDDQREMVSAKVLNTEKAVDNGYLIINEKLHVTPNHILWVNGDWRQAGQIQIGDTLRGVNGDEKVYSVEWHLEKTPVYNLEIENYHTYIADGVWVHNNKGGDNMRTDLKDTAYWNPSIQTDAQGHAKVSFKLPDNLTTWVIASIADTPDAKVGQQTAEIVVSKNIIVRPMLPNVLQEGDKIVLGAMIQNFSDSDQKMNVEARFDSGTIDNPTQTVTVPKGESAKVYWNVSPQAVGEHAKFSVKATSVDRPELNDGIVLEIPVRKFGFPEVSGTSMVNDGQYPISFPQDAFNDKSSVKMEVSASLVGSLSSAMDYLLEYPYGCVEQTTSSFVPAIISKQNKDLFQFKKTDISVDDVANKGIARLKDLQNSSGGWGWWGQDNKTNPFISAYAAEYLFKAKKAGYAVDDEMYNNMLSYIKSDSDDSLTADQKRLDKIGKTYALSIIEKGNHPDRLIKDFNGLTPDYLSLAVMANSNNGDMNSADNGIDVLAGLAKDNGESAYWDAGGLKYFGSKEASTALALRALIAGKGDTGLIDRAVKYLAQGRKGSSWENTFATAQVLQAFVDWARLRKATNVNSTYTVSVDGQQIAQGKFNDYRQIDEMNIPLDKLKANGSQISIKKDGAGDVYSTIIATAFRTDRGAGALNKGYVVTRSYKPEGTDTNSPLAVGDVVNVTLSVKSDFDDKYVVIEDHLPSGLVPINHNFNNEQASGGGEAAQLTNGKSDGNDNRDVTKDGMIISVEDLPKGTTQFTYRARVISQGEFTVIPAVANKMYAPEIYGRTAVQKITVQRERQNVVKNIVQKKNILAFIVSGIIVVLLLAGGGGYYIWKKKRGATLG
ncbi:MAG TPA: alpha-2-macroglobulin family protein [Patescibacteria group bacterium]